MPLNANAKTRRGEPWLTCAQVARVLQRSVGTIQRWTACGRLTSTPGRGWARDDIRLYDPEDVRIFAARLFREDQQKTHEGILTAKVFKAIKEGYSFEDIVIEFEQPASTILKLWKQYHDGFTGAIVPDDRRNNFTERLERAAGVRRAAKK